MNIDHLKDISVPEFIRAVLPSLPKDKLDAFCDPMEFEKSQLHAQMPYETELFLFRNDERCEIHLSHGGRIVNIAARFLESPARRDDFKTLPNIQLNSIQVGRVDELKQKIYEDAFYAEGQKPNMLKSFHNRATGQQSPKAHDLNQARMDTTFAGMDYACMHLSSRITPSMGALSPIFDKAPLSRPLALGAARLHGIRAIKINKKQ